MTMFRKAPILVTIAGGMMLALTVAAQSMPAAQPNSPAPAPASASAASAATAPVSWTVFSGYKRYHGNCSVCHGPDGLGGTFAPALATSLKTMDHDTFLETVVNGKENAQLAMPAFGADPNVMCYIEDIYAYLKARSEDQIGRGRPAPQPAKPADVAKSEAECMGA
ncbi:MAG TPA: c-type cytochrome [Sphingomonas sp.]|jgi:methanol metabolism-related c-type cytochrome|uniref:c-type cytochrome n=1 Tax=Sphingomonas sp. TaxID=28214 RepID=UPI002ED843DA